MTSTSNGISFKYLNSGYSEAPEIKQNTHSQDALASASKEEKTRHAPHQNDSNRRNLFSKKTSSKNKVAIPEQKPVDKYDLARFDSAQDSPGFGNITEGHRTRQSTIYEDALYEITNGEKVSHWIWFIFPQIKGLYPSDNSKFFAISSLDEARAYLDDALLGGRLEECCKQLLKVRNRTAFEIFGDPDDEKVRASLTLFDIALNNNNNIFSQCLKVYFEGNRDERTIASLMEDSNQSSSKK